jgi:hypothetical protein
MRLLDDVLEVLGAGGVGAEGYKERRQRAVGLMRDAFSGGARFRGAFCSPAGSFWGVGEFAVGRAGNVY